MMKSARCLLALLLLLASNTHAEALNKCISGSGAVSWQTTPCARGMRMVKSIEYTPDPPTPLLAHQQVRTSVKISKSRVATGYRGSARTTRRARPKHNPCARARERREATLQRVGLKRNFDLLSKLDADVRSVCR